MNPRRFLIISIAMLGLTLILVTIIIIKIATMEVDSLPNIDVENSTRVYGTNQAVIHEVETYQAATQTVHHQP
jgi:hypothetical protein